MYGVIPFKGRTAEVVSKEEIDQVLEATFEVLKDPGIKIANEEALHILRQGGAEVDNQKEIVRIPRSLVEWAIGQIRPFSLYGRNPNYEVKSGTGEIHFGSGMGATFVIDLESRERRPATKSDLENLVRLQDALENTHFVMPEVIPHDVPKEASDMHISQAILANTEKPCGLPASDAKEAKDLVKMGVAIAGNEEALRRRPIFGVGVGIVSPLILERERADVLLELCRLGIPIRIYSIPIGGATAPATLAGTLVVQTAEIFAGLTLAQLVRPGTPVRCGGYGSMLDQKYGIFAFGSPENVLVNAAMLQILKHYKIPSRSSATVTHSNVLDAQVGYEYALPTLFSALAGSEWISQGVSCGIEGTFVAVYEMGVIANEICSIVYRILRGIELNPDTLAVDVIREVGPGGHFLTHNHTREYYKIENWEPTLSNRMQRDGWSERGGKDILQRATDEVRRILATHYPKPLEKDVQRKLEQIVREAEES